MERRVHCGVLPKAQQGTIAGLPAGHSFLDSCLIPNLSLLSSQALPVLRGAKLGV